MKLLAPNGWENIFDSRPGIEGWRARVDVGTPLGSISIPS